MILNLLSRSHAPIDTELRWLLVEEMPRLQQSFKAPQIKDADTIASDRRRAEVRSPSAG